MTAQRLQLALGRTGLRYYRTVFPQMSLRLDEEEAAQLRFAFEDESRA